MYLKIANMVPDTWSGLPESQFNLMVQENKQIERIYTHMARRRPIEKHNRMKTSSCPFNLAQISKSDSNRSVWKKGLCMLKTRALIWSAWTAHLGPFQHEEVWSSSSRAEHHFPSPFGLKICLILYWWKSWCLSQDSQCHRYKQMMDQPWSGRLVGNQSWKLLTKS